MTKHRNLTNTDPGPTPTDVLMRRASPLTRSRYPEHQPMPSITFYHRTTKGQTKVWSCWIESDAVTVSSRWGILNGKTQTTSERIAAKQGKTAVQRAQEEFARQVQKKQRAGYVTEVDAAPVHVRLETDLNFTRLPRAFAPAKPIRTVDLETALLWEQQEILGIQRKRDGMRHFLVSDQRSRLRVYSSSKEDLTEHFAPLLAAVELPPCTILDTEFVVTRADGSDDFKTVSQICRSSAGRASRLLVGSRLPMAFWAFDILYMDRLPVWHLNYARRHAALVELLESLAPEYLTAMPFLPVALPHAIRAAKRERWEGLVLWRLDQSTIVQMNGTPARVNSYKFKPRLEDDFVCTGFERGRGRNAKVVGKLRIGAYTDRGTMFMDLGRVGTGLTDTDRKQALRWTYPCVIQVEYMSRSATGLREPVFIRQRPDKKPKECVIA